VLGDSATYRERPFEGVAGAEGGGGQSKPADRMNGPLVVTRYRPDACRRRVALAVGNAPSLSLDGGEPEEPEDRSE